jgi:hypothetical protein
MAADARDPAEVYFGTNSGARLASMAEDESGTRDEVARQLPTILPVEALHRAPA